MGPGLSEKTQCLPETQPEGRHLLWPLPLPAQSSNTEQVGELSPPEASRQGTWETEFPETQNMTEQGGERM